jgi:imidazolonepropionase
VVPGYVDAHTHALFAGDRSKEYDMKLNGMGYVDIYNAGLGIRFTTESVSKSTID